METQQVVKSVGYSVRATTEEVDECRGISFGGLRWHWRRRWTSTQMSCVAHFLVSRFEAQAEKVRWRHVKHVSRRPAMTFSLINSSSNSPPPPSAYLD